MVDYAIYMCKQNQKYYLKIKSNLLFWPWNTLHSSKLCRRLSLLFHYTLGLEIILLSQCTSVRHLYTLIGGLTPALEVCRLLAKLQLEHKLLHLRCCCAWAWRISENKKGRMYTYLNDSIFRRNINKQYDYSFPVVKTKYFVIYKYSCWSQMRDVSSIRVMIMSQGFTYAAFMQV